jgi:leucyl aminopeptidase
MVAKKLFCGLSVIAFSVLQTVQASETLVAPQCLIKNMSAQHTVLSQNKDILLIQTDQSGLNELVETKHTLRKLCGGFVNVSDQWSQSNNMSAKNFLESFSQEKKSLTTTKYSINHPKEVAALYALLNPQNMWTTLETLSSFKDRYANSDTGVQSAEWVKKQILDMAALYHRTDVTVITVPTKRYKQPSILVKVGSDFSKAGIVLGSHMDGVAADFAPRPAADDDGSGTVTLLETFRTVLQSGMSFSKPLYFIWYAAEEDGLIGSQNVVQYFKDNKISAESAFNFDMTGYEYQNENTLYLIRDNTDKQLSGFVEDLIKTYVKVPVVYTSCGYSCSDHATWTHNGVKSVFPFEGKVDNDWHVDPYFHTSMDKMDIMSLEHMTDFAKVALAFVVEGAV